MNLPDSILEISSMDKDSLNIGETQNGLYPAKPEWPKISIITPSKNQGIYIEQTIRSIILQNYPNIEYIIIDGGSIDQTVDIIRKHSSSLSYWISESDNGQSHAINKALKKATGKYATWINSDDLLARDGLSKMADAIINHPDIDLFIGDMIMLNKNGELENKSEQYESSFTLVNQLASFPYVQPACFFKMDFVKKLGWIDERFHVTMDLDLFLRILLAGGKIKRINQAIGIFRVQPAAKTNTFSKQWEVERNIVFSKFLRSIKIDRSIIEKLINLNVYIDESDVYEVNLSIPQAEIVSSVKIFLTDTIFMFFWSNRFRDVHQFICQMEIYFPQWVGTPIKKIKMKAYLSIHPFSRIALNSLLKIYRLLKTLL